MGGDVAVLDGQLHDLNRERNTSLATVWICSNRRPFTRWFTQDGLAPRLLCHDARRYYNSANDKSFKKIKLVSLAGHLSSTLIETSNRGKHTQRN